MTDVSCIGGRYNQSDSETILDYSKLLDFIIFYYILIIILIFNAIFTFQPSLGNSPSFPDATVVLVASSLTFHEPDTCCTRLALFGHLAIMQMYAILESGDFISFYLIGCKCVYQHFIWTRSCRMLPSIDPKSCSATAHMERKPCQGNPGARIASKIWGDTRCARLERIYSTNQDAAEA